MLNKNAKLNRLHEISDAVNYELEMTEKEATTLYDYAETLIYLVENGKNYATVVTELKNEIAKQLTTDNAKKALAELLNTMHYYK